MIAYVSTMADLGGGEVADLTVAPMLDIIQSMTSNTKRQDDFLSTLNRAKLTIDTYRYALRRFNEVVGARAKLDLDTYTKFLKSLRDYSPSTQRLYRTAVRQYYDFCKAGDPRDFDQLDHHYLRGQGQRIPNPDMKAIAHLVEYCDTLRGGLTQLRDRAFILLLVDSGFRISEACKLKRGDIDWNHGKTVIIGKGDKQALVRISKRTTAALKDYLNARAQLDGASGKPLGSLPLFARHDKGAGKRVLPVAKGGMWFSIKGQMRKGKEVVKGRIKEAGLDPSAIRIHDLRHYFVTRVLLETGNLKAAQKLARHENIATTERYAHLTDSELDGYYEEAIEQAA